ncbi:MAG: fibronectin type III domain-containing protein [Actinomycetota bacterium]
MSERNRPESSRSVVATLLTVTIIAVSLVVTSPPISVASSSDYAITRISDPAPGVQAAGESTHAVISDDGSTLVFTSTATNLTTPATTGNPEVYARDLATGTTDLVSQRPDGSPADAPFTGFARTSADGRYVSFISEADGLVANDSNGKTDVFVRDRQAGTTTRITADDAIYTFYMPPQLSDDGLTILFGAGGPGFGDLLEGEWQSGPLTVVPGIPGAPFRNYALSGDAATIAVGYEEVGERRVGFYDRATDEITDSAVDDIADLTQFTMSDDGQLAAYVSGGAFDTQEIKLLRRGEDTPTTVFDLSFDAAELRNPWLSGDGSTLVYDTYLLDCVTGFSGNCEEFGSVSSYDVATAETLIVSRPCDDCIESGASVRPSVDESGEWIAFDSSSVDHTEQVDINAGNDAFLAQRLGNAAPAFPGGSAITVDQAGATFVDVQWDAAIDDTAVTGYELFVDGASVAIIDGDVTSATVGDLEPDTDYEIGVEAFDTADQRTDRLTVDVTTASGVGAGSAALTGSATSATTASLSWDPANPAGLTGYRVFRSDGGGAFAAVGEVDDTTTEFHDDGLDPDTTYRYRVGRLDGATVSPHTVEREITTPDVTVDRVEFRVEQILGSPFAVLGETARLEAVAAPGLTATATLSYLSWFAEDDPVNPLPAPAARTMTIPLPPDPFGAPGNYVAEFVVDDGIAEIASFAVDVEHPDGASATGTDPALPLDVSAGVRVNVDAAPDAFGFGPEDEWTLTTRGSTTPARDAILLGGGITEFSGFLPSELANIELNTSWNTLESSLVDQTLTQGRFLDAMLVPRPLGVVFFEVFNDEGDPVDGARIDIFDTSTDELRDTRFTGLGGPGRSFPEFDSTVAGEELRFEVSGPGIDPQSRTETIVAGEQTITFTALETLRGTIRGTVLNDDGTPSQSTVAVTQNDDTRTVAPAADGSFEIAAEPGLATVSAGSGSPRVGEGLVVETISVPEPPDVAEVTLRTRGVHEYTIRFDISVVEPDGTVSDGSQYGLRFTGPGNQQFGEARPSFIVTAQRGLEREYCVEAFRRGLPPQCEIVEFGLETVIDVEFIIEPAATVTGTLVDRDDNPLVGSVFQAVVTRPGVTGRPTTTLPVGLTGRNGLRIFIPEPGTWNATISWWDPDTGEVYLTQLSITVAAGQEVDLGVIRPDAAGRFNAKGNAVTVEPPQLLPDELARVRATFVNGLAETRNAAAVLSIPPGTTLDADGTLLDGEPIDGAIDVDGNLVVELGDLAPSATGVLSYHLRIDDPTIGDLPVAARIVHDDAPPPGDLIGIGTLSVAQVTLDGPTRTATGTTPLYGRAPAGSTVTILNAGQEIATTTASAGGRWRATVQLDPLPVPLEHELVASIQFDGGDLRSDALYVSIDPGWPEPIRATVQQDGGSSATWDPRQGIATFPFGSIETYSASERRSPPSN